MTTFSAPDPVSAGVFSALSVPTVTTIVTGGIGDDIAQGTGYPFLLYTVTDKRIGAMGSQPGRSGFVSELRIRLQAFSLYSGGKEAQQICGAAIGAMLVAFDATSPAVTIAGYKVCDLVWDTTSEPIDSLVAGVKVKEVVSDMTMRVELQ